jgi:4-amino-4-deoxy-L-arabinose transferase-like glycosyltransferase
MTANKIWADDMTALFVTLAVICYLYALKNNKPLFSLLAGFSCGFSIITKMSGIYLIIAILLFHVFEHRKNRVTINNIIEFLFDRNILYFLAGAFIVSALWFDLYYSSFDIRSSGGYFTVNEKWDVVKTWNAYFSVASNRPWYSYFVLVPYQFPLYLLSYIFIVLFVCKKWIKKFANLIKENNKRYLNFLIIWVTAVFTFLTLKPGKEERYMLIAYPAISILSVYCLNLFYEWMKNKNLGLSLNLKRALFISTVLLSLFFSLKIALPRILFRADIIPIPL